MKSHFEDFFFLYSYNTLKEFPVCRSFFRIEPGKKGEKTQLSKTFAVQTVKRGLYNTSTDTTDGTKLTGRDLLVISTEAN